MRKQREDPYFFDILYKGALFVVIFFISFCAFIFFPLSRNYFNVNLLYPDLTKPPKIEEKIEWDSIGANVYAASLKKATSEAFRRWFSCVPALKGALLLKCNAESESAVFRELPQYNGTLCAIYPFSTPNKKCGISVNGERRYFKEEEWVVCDTSRPSYYFNTHISKASTLLILYIERPTCIPRGTSFVCNSLFGGHLAL